MVAAENGLKDVILILIQRGANLDLVDADVFMCLCFIIKPEHHHFESIVVAIKISLLL